MRPLISTRKTPFYYVTNLDAELDDPLDDATEVSTSYDGESASTSDIEGGEANEYQGSSELDTPEGETVPCVICKRVSAVDPWQSSCSHVACHDCWLGWVQDNELQDELLCPQCEENLDPELLREDTPALKNEIEEESDKTLAVGDETDEVEKASDVDDPVKEQPIQAPEEGVQAMT